MYREDREDRGGFRPRRDSGFGGRSNFVPDLFFVCPASRKETWSE